MVFESIVVELLNRFLGSYVENLNSKQLNIGIWQGKIKKNLILNDIISSLLLGDVVLNNLVLKASALEDLNLPIQAVYGNLGVYCST